MTHPLTGAATSVVLTTTGKVSVLVTVTCTVVTLTVLGQT